MSPETRTLYRPVGLREMELILESGFRGFPPRLPGQPIFYLVLDLAYAEQIARAYYGDEFHGSVPAQFGFRGRDAIDQLVLFDATLRNGDWMDAWCEIRANWHAVQINHGFWVIRDFLADGISIERKNELLALVAQWHKAHRLQDDLPGSEGL